MFVQGCKITELSALNRLTLKKVAIVGFRFTHRHALNPVPGELSANCMGPEIFYSEIHGIDSKGNAVSRHKSNWRLSTHKSDDQEGLTAREAISVPTFPNQRPAHPSHRFLHSHIYPVNSWPPRGPRLG
jgi:hypothetical protein